MSDILLYGILVPVCVIILGSVLGMWHTIYEGHIGVYSRGGALLAGYSEPGLNWMIPIITRVNQVQITL